MLPIIDRYILSEVTKAFLAIILVLLLIVVGHSFVKILQDVASGSLGSQFVAKMVGLEALQVLGPVIPPAFFFSILYVLGRMYRDSEVTALSAGGVGTLRIYRSFFIAALPVALLVSWLTLDLLPWVNFNKESILQSQDDDSAELDASIAGRFNESSRGNMIFYVEEMSKDRTKLRNVFVQNRSNGYLSLITATNGYRYQDPENGAEYLVLTRGYQFEGIPGEADYAVGEFEKYAFQVDRKKKGERQLPIKARSTSELRNSEDIQYKSELEYRLMFPIAVLIFTLVSVPLSRSLPREGIYGRLMLAILFYFIFLNLQAVSGHWMVDGKTPEWLGRWWVHPFMLFLGGMVLFYKNPRALPRLARSVGRRVS